MSHRQPAALGLAAAAASLLLLGGLPTVGGCKGKPDSAITSPAAPATATATVGSVTFTHPASWTVNTLPDGRGVNVVAPADAGWEPNVFVEVQPNPDEKALDELMAANVDVLAVGKADLRVVTQAQLDHPAGFRYGRVEYTNTSEAAGGAAGVPLTQWSVIVPLPGKKQRLQVQAAAATAAWDKYRPAFEQAVESIRVAK